MSPLLEPGRRHRGGLPLVLGAAYSAAGRCFALVAVGGAARAARALPAGPLAAAARPRRLRRRARGRARRSARRPGVDARRLRADASARLRLRRRLARRDSRRRSRSPTTVLGAAWIGLGLGFLILLRDLEPDGGSLLITVLADRLRRGHVRLRRRPPRGPAQDGAGHLAGQDAGRASSSVSSAASLTAWLALYDEPIDVDGWEAFVLGGVDRPRRGRRRPLRVARQARPRREGLGPAARWATEACSTGSTRSSSPRPAAYFARVARRLTLTGPARDVPCSTTRRTMKRIALLGATGSIGRQALEIVDAPSRSSSSCAAALGVRRRSTSAGAPLTPVGGDLDELLDRARARRRPQRRRRLRRPAGDARALERGIDLALANKESLVAAGDLALAAWERGGGRLLPVDSEHSAAFQCLEGRGAGDGRLARAHRLGRAVPRPHAAASSPTSRRPRRSRTRPGAWARRSPSTRRRS